jgi:glycosyltransferase involved in cell wall biosynthesis
MSSLAPAERRPLEDAEQMTDHLADVTVVIPTHARPHACRSAVLSALGQTLEPQEVIVVIDGEDPSAYDELEHEIDDKRLRVLRPLVGHGASEARNLGVHESTARVVAFLDDDDVWLPTKLETQLDAVERAVGPDTPFVSTTAMAAVGTHHAVRWPGRDPLPGEPVADFLFGLGVGPHRGRVVQTSTYLASREVAIATPMRGRAFEDWDWLIRASLIARHVHVAEPLVVFHRAEDTLTSLLDLDDAEAWIESLRPLISPEAYAAACLTVLARGAATSGTAADVVRVLRRSFRGRPAVRQLAEFPAVIAKARRDAHRPR